MADKDSIIVAIELGSSKISGIAGKVKDGTFQILAYAEDKTSDCVKRGVVYNIEKTTQSIKNVVSKLEISLKMKINRTYIGLGGQSVRSIKNVVKKNMLTPTYINQTHIDTITDESHEVPFDDYELIGYFTQDFIVDSNVVAEPVGVMGTNLEGEFLNVIANKRLKNNINTVFENLGLEIADYRLSAFELANNILTDTEKRSGCAMVDFGDGTTTIAVLKNNIVRQLITIPLGINNIKQDLCDEQLEEQEAIQLLQTYANAVVENTTLDEEENTPMYTTTDGRQIEIIKIQHIIEARLHEILVNVEHQLVNSDYSGKLLGGLVITGGGANIKNIDKACQQTLKVDKVRVAKKLIPQVIKNSDITALSTESASNCTIISLLLAGNENCVGEAYDGPDIFTDKKKEDEINDRKEAVAEQLKEEEEAVAAIEKTKADLRDIILKLEKASTDIQSNEANKRLISKGDDLLDEADNVVDENFTSYRDKLLNKDKYKQTLREADFLISKKDEEVEKLENIIAAAKKKNSPLGKISSWLETLLND